MVNSGGPNCTTIKTDLRIAPHFVSLSARSRRRNPRKEGSDRRGKISAPPRLGSSATIVCTASGTWAELHPHSMHPRKYSRCGGFVVGDPSSSHLASQCACCITEMPASPIVARTVCRGKVQWGVPHTCYYQPMCLVDLLMVATAAMASQFERSIWVDWRESS